MRMDRGWSDLDRFCVPSPICDGHVCLDRSELEYLDNSAGHGSLSRQLLDDLDEHLPPSVVTHLVFTVNDGFASIDEWISGLIADRQIRFLVGPDISYSACDGWPVVGLVLDRYERLARALSQMPDDNDTDKRIIYIEPEALADDLLVDLRKAIFARRETTFVFASLGGRYWRFATLLAGQTSNVMLDTSKLTARRLRSLMANRYQLGRLLNRYSEKLIFASGNPIARPLTLMAIILPWFSSSRAAEAVMRENALRLYFSESAS